MDFPYLRRVTQLNVAALAALARAPMPPEPTVEGAVSTDTTFSWRPVAGAAALFVRWRRTDAANWEHSLRVGDSDRSTVTECRVRLPAAMAETYYRDAARHPRRRLGVRRLLGGGGRVGEPGRLGGAGRGVQARMSPPPPAAPQ